MKKTIHFSKFFLPAAIISITIFIVGVGGFLLKGFALGVDFQAGLIQEVRLAPTAFSLRWSGVSNAILSFDRGGVYIVVSGAGAETGADRTLYSFQFSEYATIGALAQAMERQLDDIDISITASENTNSQWLIFSTYGNPYLGEVPFVVHYLAPDSAVVDITEMRSAMSGLGQSVSVQSLGSPHDRHFMIRVEDEEGQFKSEQINSLLEAHFGKGEIAVLRSDYVASRFSKDLTDQAGILTALTLLLILIYASIRFKPQYAFGAVIAIINDGIVIVSFVVWTRMEFNTSTIAAILTILGYSINNTIVVFDRIRENRRIYPDHSFLDILDISLTGVLSRTIITTLTTMLAVLFLFIFVTGSMKDFALALLVGMLSGVYTTLFIASGFVYFWDVQKNKIEKGKAARATVKS